ncbi:MAG: beta-N-acetylglucosaminidase domain-containing protein [Deltaproteobacteria bacterium]|nr:beta-N-acetylglucosaminidase domain-containing protein [Deltaproteobacteria bacterium]
MSGLGFVEGFYGRPWSWDERSATAEFLAVSGYSSYLYAPKADLFLRRRWRERWPDETARKLRALAALARARGLSFGVGLSPHELHVGRAADEERLVLEKVEVIVDELGAAHLALLFDDMKGDVPELAKTQVALAHAVKARWPKLALSLCPTYYSLDSALDRLFGPRPPHYLDELGRALDPSIGIFWTGERICSTSYSLEHLREVGGWLKRKPLLWDNYPVNDTEKMSPFFDRAARATLGPELAALVRRDRELFQEHGLEKIEPARKTELRAEYGRFSQPGAREVVDWLGGRYAVTSEMVKEQL